MHNTEIECKAIIQLWFSADDINHKSLLVYEQQQQQYTETELLPVYLIRDKVVLPTIQKQYVLVLSSLIVNR